MGAFEHCYCPGFTSAWLTDATIRHPEKLWQSCLRYANDCLDGKS